VEGLGVRKSVWVAVLAGAALALALAVGLRLARSGDAPPTAASTVSTPPAAPQPLAAMRREPAAVAAAQPGGRPRAIRRGEAAPPAGAPRPAEPVAGPPPVREDAPFSFGPPGEQTGIALFPAMGSDPPKRGILVPEDFELPPGYLRHYQSTDDGEPLPAILMFHPDFEFVDANGAPIELPADRVVPPWLAPPGMPIEMLELPAARAAEEGAP
jgi:hypothetical protein